MSEKPPQNNIEKPSSPIGVGSEKRIYNDPINKDRVIAKFHEHIEETVNQTKARYYLTKILHLLLPKNIPDMHWTGSDPHAYAIDKVEVDESHKKLQKY